MNQIAAYNSKGESVEKVSLPKDLFKKSSPVLFAQAVRVYLANKRVASAKTKTRGDVAKTTAKMYKQKGTGRARHGSYSAPIFVGGGVSHGPSGEQNWLRKLSKGMTKRAVLGTLYEKIEGGNALVLKEASKMKAKTSVAVDLYQKLFKDNKGKLLLLTSSDQNDVRKIWRNIKDVDARSVNRLSPYRVILSQKVLLTNEALEELIQTYAN
jgi:large subunit ribosomal protein L4